MKLLKIIKLIFLLLFLVIELDSTPHRNKHCKNLKKDNEKFIAKNIKASTSNVNSEQCPCGKYDINELNGEENINGIELKIKNNGKYIDNGSFGDVFHAYWPKENKCVALKITYLKNPFRDVMFLVKREVDVLNYLNEQEKLGKERNYIIRMFEYEEIGNFMYIMLELGEKNLKEYFRETIKAKGGIVEPRTNQDFLIKIIKGAALALNQFHKFGVHGDVKAENFVVFKENEDIIESKLIDFNISVIEGQEPLEDTSELAINLKAPEIQNLNELTREADVWAFGRMVYMLFHNSKTMIYKKFLNSIEEYRSNEEYNTKLDNIIKACLQEEPEERPNVDKILSLLNALPFKNKQRENEHLEKKKGSVKN